MDAGADTAGTPALRTKAAVVASRYLASIDEAKHGIVRLHDRVGDVGSTYALDPANVWIPALQARGYVFAAPALAFSRLAPHADLAAFDRARACRARRWTREVRTSFASATSTETGAMTFVQIAKTRLSHAGSHPNEELASETRLIAARSAS